jgi:hypothetical protein
MRLKNMAFRQTGLPEQLSNWSAEGAQSIGINDTYAAQSIRRVGIEPVV